VEDVPALLGHRSIETTLGYVTTGNSSVAPGQQQPAADQQFGRDSAHIRDRTRTALPARLDLDHARPEGVTAAETR
jgi:hypothetical protein